MVLRVLMGLCAIGLVGCQRGPQLVPPEVLVSPYSADARGEPLWAVAPLRNESGASIADVLRISDAVVAATAEVRGLTVLPVNRTIAAMRALNLSGVASADDARRLAEALGADALIVGSITAYDPYDPPKLGLALALYTPSVPTAPEFDPGLVRTAASEAGLPAPAVQADSPLSVASAYLDASNHGVLMDVKRYSTGRRDDSTALGWRTYLVSMDHFTQFAANYTVGRLLDRERLRLARISVAIKSAPR